MMGGTIFRVSMAVAGAVLVVSACGAASVDDRAGTAGSSASTDASSATSPDAPPVTDSAPGETVVTADHTSAPGPSSTPSAEGALSTGGDQPTFTWAPIDRATLYSVVVTTSDGSAFWAWQGTETTATVGDGAPDPLVSADMMWSVVALSDTGDGLWESGLLPV
jgi:hypothetical protein